MEMLTDPLYGNINTGRSAIVLAFFIYLFSSLCPYDPITLNCDPGKESKQMNLKSLRKRNSF